MKKLVDIVSKDNSILFSSEGKSILEEDVMPLIEKKIVDLNLPGKEGVLVYVPEESNSLMKESLEVLSAPYSSVLFSSGGSRVSNNGAWRMIKEDCTLYLIRNARGTLVYMTKEEYEKLRKEGRIY